MTKFNRQNGRGSARRLKELKLTAGTAELLAGFYGSSVGNRLPALYELAMSELCLAFDKLADNSKKGTYKVPFYSGSTR
ncbi:hypothetical protein N9W21_00605 [Shewanella sp.]|nr:hypothetical protein [Shewanella sp.]